MKTFHYMGSDFFKVTSTYLHCRNTCYPISHDHDYWECLLLLDGSATHITDVGIEQLKQGDFRLLSPKRTHYIKQIDNSYAECTFSVTDELLRQLCASFDENFYDYLCKQTGAIPYHFNETELNDFRNHLHFFQTLSADDWQGQSTIIKIIFTQILHKLYVTSLYDQAAHSVYPNWLNHFIKEIKSPKHLCLKVEEVHKLTNFSHCQFNRLFKKYTGTTFVSFFREIKLNYAAALLSTTDLTTLSISSAIGYDSLGHFNMIFKKHFGCTPTEYKTRVNHQFREKKY